MQRKGEGDVMANGRKRCFVLMGFGQKVDYKTKRTLDLDKTYRIIRAAVEEAGLECVRADDIVHSGVIDKPMYENLLMAEVAIADLSTSNENAIYEMGVRHALKPRTTIIIAEREFKFPFDLGHVVIRPYDHLGSGIDFEEAERLKKELVKAIGIILSNDEVDSPVYTFLHGLQPPAFLNAAGPQAAVETDDTTEPAGRTTLRGLAAHETLFSTLLEAFREARKQSDFTTARVLIDKLRSLKPGTGGEASSDPYLVQQHAFVTYMSKQPTKIAALEDARRVLATLEVEKTGDPETLGLWGAIHKRLWDETRDRAALDEGIFAYARGFYIKRDYYTGINYAFMLDDRARMQTSADEQTADRVTARRVRRQVLAIVEAALDSLPRNQDGSPQDPAERYWLAATRVEALMGLGDSRFEDERAKLFATAPEGWMNASTDSQLGKLADLLKASAVGPPATDG
jgi:MAP3K TRAFs-binding domain